MIIKNIPELLKTLDYYKNPYILCHYRGIDWSLYEKYNYNKNPYVFEFSNNLKLISSVKNQEYKFNNKDFLFCLKGKIIINENKTLYSNMYYNFDVINEKLILCKGEDYYNSFFHYSHD